MWLSVLLEVHEGLGTRPYGLLQMLSTGESAFQLHPLGCTHSLMQVQCLCTVVDAVPACGLQAVVDLFPM